MKLSNRITITTPTVGISSRNNVIKFNGIDSKSLAVAINVNYQPIKSLTAPWRVIIFSTTSQWTKSSKKQSMKCIFHNMALYFECRINKKRTPSDYFLAILLTLGIYIFFEVS